MAEAILRARWVLPDAQTCFEDAGVHVARGRILRVVRRSGVQRAARAAGVRVLDLGDVVLAPGFVNAHAHLDLCALAGAVRPAGSFTCWIRALLVQRSALGRPAMARAARAGADRLLATGTTTVGDIDASGVASRALARHALRRRAYREVLDAGDPARTRAALARATRRARRVGRVHDGLSPHAPYTVSEGLWSGLGRLARARRLHLAIHWAETREEVDWLAHGRGPMKAILSRSPRRSGLDAIERAGLLGPRTTLVHGNEPEPGDLERLARAGATLVHCPGTHAFFARAPFPFARARDLGVGVALGTDSLASNSDLDIGREMRLVRQAAPWLPPSVVWEMATRAGGAAVGLVGQVGELSPRAWADLCVHRPLARVPPRRSHVALLDALTAGGTCVERVWIAGRSAFDATAP